MRRRVRMPRRLLHPDPPNCRILPDRSSGSVPECRSLKGDLFEKTSRRQRSRNSFRIAPVSGQSRSHFEGNRFALARIADLPVVPEALPGKAARLAVVVHLEPAALPAYRGLRSYRSISDRSGQDVSKLKYTTGAGPSSCAKYWRPIEVMSMTRVDRRPHAVVPQCVLRGQEDH